jgi:hypothetical protein
LLELRTAGAERQVDLRTEGPDELGFRTEGPQELGLQTEGQAVLRTEGTEGHLAEKAESLLVESQTLMAERA